MKKKEIEISIESCKPIQGETYGQTCARLEEIITSITTSKTVSKKEISVLAFALMEAPSDLGYGSNPNPFKTTNTFLSEQTDEIREFFKVECEKHYRRHDSRITMLLSRELPSDKKWKRIPTHVMEDFEKEILNVRTRNEKIKKHQTESIDIVVGKHAECGGEIHYYSEFVISCSANEVRIGGQNPVREVTSCSCNKCGILFNTDFKPYRDQVTSYRNRPVE